MENLYDSFWGFVHKRGRSLWTEAEHSRGGVAILLNPYSSIKEMFPWSEAHWTPQWKAVQINLLVEPGLFFNVYAPSVKTKWESMFVNLLFLLLQEYDGPMFIGGDYNCT